MKKKLNNGNANVSYVYSRILDIKIKICWMDNNWKKEPSPFFTFMLEKKRKERKNRLAGM